MRKNSLNTMVGCLLEDAYERSERTGKRAFEVLAKSAVSMIAEADVDETNVEENVVVGDHGPGFVFASYEAGAKAIRLAYFELGL